MEKDYGFAPRFTGIVLNWGHWRICWTKGYTNWEEIFWFGPVGIMRRC